MGLFDKVKNKFNDLKRISEIETKVKNKEPITQEDLDFYNEKHDIDDFVKKIIIDKLTNFKKYSKTLVFSDYGISCYSDTAVLKSSDFGFIKLEDIDSFQVGYDEAIKTDGKVVVKSTTKGGFGVGRAAAGALVLGPVGALVGFTKKKKTNTVNKKAKETPILKDVRLEILTKNGMTYKHIIDSELKDTQSNRKNVEAKFEKINKTLPYIIDNVTIPPRTYEEYIEQTEEPFNYILLEDKES